MKQGIPDIRPDFTIKARETEPLKTDFPTLKTLAQCKRTTQHQIHRPSNLITIVQNHPRQQIASTKIVAYNPQQRKIVPDHNNYYTLERKKYQ